MSYLSRLYNHRNAQSPEGKEKPFFSKKQQGAEKQNKGNFFQAKLSVNEPGDKYEHEADNVAKAVVDNKTAKPVVQQKEISSVQRLATSLEDEKLGTNDRRMERDKEDKVKAVQRALAPEKEKDKAIQKMDTPKKEEEKPKVQKMELPEKKKEEGPPPVQKMGNPEKDKLHKKDNPVKEEEKPPIQKMGTDHEKDKLQKKDGHKKEEEKHGAAVQTKHDASANTASPQVATNLQNSAGKGKALPIKTMHEMSTSFGADFSNVRIHNDSEAANMNQELQALAFTHGRDIYFNEGKFDPDSSQGKFLLAHELTHVVQQGEKKEKVSRLSDPECGGSNSLPLVGACHSGFVHNCYSEAFVPATASAVKIIVNADYTSSPGPIVSAANEDFSVQMYKCHWYHDTKIGIKRISNIGSPLTYSIASVEPGETYYINIYTRSHVPIDATYTISQ